MAIVILQLPNVKRKTEIRPKKCPYCPGEAFQRWGKVRKPVRDNKYRSVQVYRYRCCHCHRSFRYYPEGVGRADQTERLRNPSTSLRTWLATICWVLGLSLRGVTVMLSAFGIQLSHMIVWRDMDEAAQALARRRQWKKVRVLGLDGLYPLGWGKKRPVIVAVDLGDRQPVAIGYVDESNPQAVCRSA